LLGYQPNTARDYFFLPHPVELSEFGEYPHAETLAWTGDRLSSIADCSECLTIDRDCECCRCIGQALESEPPKSEYNFMHRCHGLLQLWLESREMNKISRACWPLEQLWFHIECWSMVIVCWSMVKMKLVFALHFRVKIIQMLRNQRCASHQCLFQTSCFSIWTWRARCGQRAGCYAPLT